MLQVDRRLVTPPPLPSIPRYLLFFSDKTAEGMEELGAAQTGIVQRRPTWVSFLSNLTTPLSGLGRTLWGMFCKGLRHREKEVQRRRRRHRVQKETKPG